MKVVQPKRGKKKDLLELATENASVALKEKFSLIERDEKRTIHAIEQLGKAMGIATPYRIEAFDNSNIQGIDPVSAMVTFFWTESQIVRITVSIKSKRFKVLMIMAQCERLSAAVM